MGLRTHSKDIPVIVDPLSFVAEIEVLGGNNAQTFNQDTKEYEPNRKLVPCLLMPSVSIADPDNKMTGNQPISGCEWYEGSPKQDGSNRIINGEFYEISAEGKPKWSLKVMKNVEPNIPLDIHAIFTIVDTRRNMEVKFERSISLYTALYDSKVYSVKITNQPESFVIDPLRITPGADGSWPVNISAQLYSGKEQVPDANAAYWWQIYQDGVWRDITKDETDICVKGKDAQGNWTKDIVVDARFFRDAAFRCRASYYDGARPSVPANEAIQARTGFKVEYPKTLAVDIVQTAGAKVSADMSTPVSFECVISDNMTAYRDKDEFFLVEWWAKSGKPSTADKKIGTGRTISFVPSSIGFDKLYTVAVYAVVKLHVTTALVTNGGKVTLTNGKAVTFKIYE